MLSNGALVEIFEDPLTMVRKEGNAEIVQHIQEVEPGVGQYVVHFIGDAPGFHVVRTIAESLLCCCLDPVHPDNPNCRVHWAGVK